MITRLDRYLLARFFISWSVALTAFSVFYLLVHFFAQIDGIGRAERGFAAMNLSLAGGLARFFLSNLVFVMTVFLPFTVLIAAMWAGQQIAKRGELLAMVTSGIKLQRVGLLFLLAAASIGVMGGAIREFALPALAPLRYHYDRAMKGRSEGTMDRLPMLEDPSGQRLHIGRYDPVAEIAYAVRILGPAGEGIEPIDVAELRFSQGQWTAVGTSLKPLDAVRVASLSLSPRDLEMLERTAAFASIQDVRRQLARDPSRAALQMQLHAHWAYPFSCLVLPLIGLSLVLKPSRKTPWIAVGTGILLSIAYFVTERILIDLGTRDELLSPIVAAWLPLVLFSLVGLFLSRKSG